MAQRMPDDSMLKDARKLGRGYPLPWDQWLDGSVWCVKKGEDFSAKDAAAFRIQVYKAARDRGLKVRIRVADDTTLYMQAYLTGKDRLP